MKRVLGKGLEALIPSGTDSETIITTSDTTGLNLVRDIPLANIKPSPFQPRVNFDSVRLYELAQSIEARGVIQPIVVRPIDDKFELIVGERRLRAMEILGRATVPAIVIESISNEEAMELTLIENIQREDLNPIEEAQAYYRLITECNLSQSDVAAKVGKERSSVSNAIRLLSLPQDILDLLSDGKLSAGHGRALLTLSDDAEKIALAGRVVLEEMSVRDLEKIAYADKSPKKNAKVRLRSPQVLAIEDTLKRHLGTKVSLVQRRKGGRITIEYYSNDELERLLGIFGVKE
jgi:ParB family transcriptional regulator, chromosome partitioning protein